jgi:diamine N-acetyltransferase
MDFINKNPLGMTGEKVRLRALEPDDVDTLFIWENDPSVWRISNTQAPFSRHVLDQYVASSHQDIYATRQLRLMIERLDDTTAVGCIDLFEFEPAHARAGIGILVAKRERNQGYATEALALLVDYCFNVLGLHQVFCHIGVGNEASLRLFQNAGFEITGTKKDWMRLKNQWTAEYMLQLINKDY